MTMTTNKSYTDLSQSKTLSKILPLESADMSYCAIHNVGQELHHCNIPIFIYASNKDIPCWSLAALLEQFPYELCDDDGNSVYLEINKEDDLYQLVYTDPYGDFKNIETDRYEHFVDACYEMIINLKEKNLL